jgi:hypothetical protein
VFFGSMLVTHEADAGADGRAGKRSARSPKRATEAGAKKAAA